MKSKKMGRDAAPQKTIYGIKSSIEQRIWVLQYELEEARQDYASSGRLLKQAAVCILLAILRIGRAA
jgi:hypothetical protein